jgi:hypothetical protein
MFGHFRFARTITHGFDRIWVIFTLFDKIWDKKIRGNIPYTASCQNPFSLTAVPELCL